MTTVRYRVPIRYTYPNDSLEYANAVASCKVEGYTFLVHQHQAGYTATYAPVGLHCGGPYESIEASIAAIFAYGDRSPQAIQYSVDEMNRKYMPLLAPENGIETILTWREREQERFDTGEYQSVPSINGLEYPKEHYVHLSVTKTESDFVAYTPSESHGERDRQTRLKFGKYLRKAFPEMSDATIQDSVNKLRSKLALDLQPATLYFATDRETINEIFETEMCACDSTYTSCMHGKFNEHVTRPYHVYAGSPDVAVAYVKAQGNIVSRSVVSTKDKIWVRAYSRKDGDSATDCATLKTLLGEAGYQRGDLYGNRLTKLDSRRPMLPYIDTGGCGVVDSGEYWKVCPQDEGDFNADSTDGYATECVPRCECCGRAQDDCECYRCECCEELSTSGCESCSMCPICDGCTEHDACECERCSECNEILEVPSRHRRAVSECECERCAECNELVTNCDCEKCDDCGELTENCECTKDEETTDDETPITLDTVGDVEVQTASAFGD